jgi:hypothetical protein
VKKECVEYSTLSDFLESPIDEEKLVVIHIDTAEAERTGYDVRRPKAEPGLAYTSELYNRVLAKLKEWLAGRGSEHIRYAIAVEEMDAWILTIYSNKDTSVQRDPKKTLERKLNQPNRMSEKERKRLFQLGEYAFREKLSLPFRKPKTLVECSTRNESLRLFVESLSPGENEPVKEGF